MKRKYVNTTWGYNFEKVDEDVNNFIDVISEDGCEVIDIKTATFVGPASGYEYLVMTVIYSVEEEVHGQNVKG